MILNSYDEFMEYVIDKFYEEDDIQVICDFDLADLLTCEFGNVDYVDYKGIDLQSDVDEYYVTKIKDEFFCVEPLKVNSKIKTTTSDYFIIDNDILENNPTLFNYLEGNNFTVDVIDYDEEYDCKNCYGDCNDCEYAEEDAMDLDKVFGGDSIEEEIELADLIDEYVGLILDNDCEKEAIGYALTEFAGKILENFCLEKE